MMILEGMFIGAWIANKWNTKISIQIFIIGIYWAFMVYPFTPFFSSKPAEDLFLYIFITLIINSLIVVLIDSSNRRLILFWIILINATFVYGLGITIDQLDEAFYTPLKNVFVDVPILNFAFPMIFIFICLVTHKFKTEQEKAQNKLEVATKKLSQEKSNLEEQNHQLSSTIGALEESELALKELNSTLEVRIDQRMQELDDLNERILNHGFLNSVTIQNSFEKILLSDEVTRGRDENIQYDHYNRVTNELDEIVNSIGQNLQIADTKLNE